MGSSRDFSWAAYLRPNPKPKPEYKWAGPPANAPDRIREYVQQLESTYFFAGPETPESLAHMIEWYRKHAPGRRRAFRASGVLVIVIGAFLPFLAAFGGRLSIGGRYLDKDMAVAGLAVILSVLAALNQFFRWDESWRGQIQSMFKLQRLRIMWEAKKAEAYQLADTDEALRVLRGASEELIRGAHDVAGQEMNEFFELQRFPEMRPPDGKSPAHQR